MKNNELREIKKWNDWEEAKKWGLSFFLDSPNPKSPLTPELMLIKKAFA